MGSESRNGGAGGKAEGARVQVLDSGKIAGVIELRASLPEQIDREIPDDFRNGGLRNRVRMT